MNEPATGEKPRIEIRQQALRQELKELLDVVGPAQLVELLMERSTRLRATDIHLDPQEDVLRVRLRVDGMLHDVLDVPSDGAPQMISRVKLLAGMNISERRLPQDGHISRQFLGEQRDVRVGSGPTMFGERLVLRLMPTSNTFRRLDELGMDADQILVLRESLAKPYGMILSVGPVGSGKSTTMASALDLLNNPNRSLVSIEDPIERRVPGIIQIQIETKINFGFVEALRGVLRQDPNVVMLGEIRDPETAQIAVRASRTGIMVLSTMHARDTIACFEVFRDFGVPPMFLADSTQAVIAQRLVRVVCANCKTSFAADEATRRALGQDRDGPTEVILARGTGCDACFGTGYLGRTGVFEILIPDDNFRHAIMQGAARHDLVNMARAKGMRSLHASAVRKVLDGITTVEEINRIFLSDPADA